MCEALVETFNDVSEQPFPFGVRASSQWFEKHCFTVWHEYVDTIDRRSK